MTASVTRRQLLQTTGAVALGLGLAGGARRRHAAAQPTGDIEFWSRETQDNGIRQPLIEERLAAFDAANGTSSTAQFMVFQESIEKTQAALAAGTAPDLGQQGPDVSLGFAAGGRLAPIDDIYARLQPGFLPLQREAFVEYEGSTYAVPWYMETRSLFYHTDLFEEAGVQPPVTWDEWLAAAQALTKGDEQYGFILPAEGLGMGQLWVPLASSAGGDLLDAQGLVQANTDPFRQSLQFLSDFYAAGVMPEATPTYKANDVTQLFLLKKSAMILSNGAILQSIATQAPQVRETLGCVLVPVPTAGAVSRSFLGGFELFVFAESQNPDGAKALLEFLFEPEWYASYIAATNGSALPSTSAAAALPIFQEDPILATLIEQEATAVRYGGPTYGNAPFIGEAEGAMLFAQPAIDVLTGTKTVDEAVLFLDTELKKLAGQA